MTLAPPTGRADALAARSLARNLVALEPRALRELVERTHLPACEWAFARDGALTARVDGQWLAGTGLPARAAGAVMASADAGRPSSCLLSPTHGRQVTALLDRLGPSQTVVAVFDDAASLAWALRCVDASDALSAGRLHVVLNEVESIADLAERVPGLVVPNVIFRPGDAPAATGLVEQTKRALLDAGRRRAARAAEVAARPPTRGGAVAVFAPATFRLWDDAGHALWSAAAGLDRAVRVDGDDPRSASPLALALTAESGVLAADVLRGDLPGTVHDAVPWATWVTRDRPPARYGGGRDAVILAENEWLPRWRAAGWPAARLSTATWPATDLVGDATGGPTLFADLPAGAPPADVEAYSSQRLLWEQIALDVGHAPLLLHDAASPAEFVRRRAAAAGLKDVPVARFVAGCVLPAYARGVARLLAKAGLHFRIRGRGWEQVEGVGSRWRGPVECREEFEQLRDAASAVIVACPKPTPATRVAGPRAVHTAGHTEASLIAAVRRGGVESRPPACPTLTADVLAAALAVAAS